MKKVLLTLLCASLIVAFGSCQSDAEKQEAKEILYETYDLEVLADDPEGVEYSFSFQNVEELRTAIKKDPDKYNNAKIKVIGTIKKHDDGFELIDFFVDSTTSSGDGGLERYELHQEINASNWKIDVYIANEAQYAVGETGDYVKFYGTLHLNKDGVYLSDGQYDLIASFDERVEMTRRKETGGEK